jgi:hypothetical protein
MKNLFLLFLALQIGCINLQGQTDTEKEIISSLIEEEFSQDPDDSIEDGNEENKNLRDQEEIDIVIILESRIQSIDTVFYSLAGFQKMGLASLDLNTMNDFYNKNQKSIQIKKFCSNEVKIKYLSQKEWNEIMDQGSWKHYHSIYGYIPTINLSRPGINEGMNKAFMYYDAKTDKLGGAGFYVMLEKVEEKWVIKEKIIAWRS